MILFELTRGEHSPFYQGLEISNGARHYSFLESIVAAALEVQRPMLSHAVIKALNFHAIACLHPFAGEYRPCQVSVGSFIPPDHWRVQGLMDDLIDDVNRKWTQTDPVVLGTYVLWRLNFIHPFINGNGRTARAVAYYVLCLSAGGWLKGETILPELLRRDRSEYVDALRLVDQSYNSGELVLDQLHALVVRLLQEQIGSVDSSSG